MLVAFSILFFRSLNEIHKDVTQGAHTQLSPSAQAATLWETDVARDVSRDVEINTTPRKGWLGSQITRVKGPPRRPLCLNFPLQVGNQRQGAVWEFALGPWTSEQCGWGLRSSRPSLPLHRASPSPGSASTRAQQPPPHSLPFCGFSYLRAITVQKTLIGKFQAFRETTVNRAVYYSCVCCITADDYLCPLFIVINSLSNLQTELNRGCVYVRKKHDICAISSFLVSDFQSGCWEAPPRDTGTSAGL